MGQVNVTVNGRQYSIGCEDGEEQRVAHLARVVDSRTSELVRSLGGASAGEARVLLMAALLIADELETAADEAEALKSEAGALRRGVPRFGHLADRCEAVAARLRRP